MQYLKKSKLFYLVVLMILLLFLAKQISDLTLLMKVLTITVNTLLIPLVITLFLYYLLRPVYLICLKWFKKESLSLLATFGIFILILVFFTQKLIPLLLSQIDMLINNLPKLISELDQLLLSLNIYDYDQKALGQYLELINHSFEDLFNMFFVGLKNGTNFVFRFVSQSFLIVSLVPIMLYYLLKNTQKSHHFEIIPEKFRALSIEYFHACEQVLADYISGKAMVCFYVFIGALISFTIGGLPNAFLFAVVAGIMDIVPYFGPWIGAFPAVLSALLLEQTNVWLIIVGIIIVQLGESYIVSPLVMSKEMKLHPLAIIILMLITGQTFGLIGMIIILPIVALLKVSAIYLIKLKQQYKKSQSVHLDSNQQ
ncbi:MAG: AI-2E family transporter [Streptococcaceae bacterium]|jgi:predicted PurR-regulated permease PerM|nr:AI-2E family transporter [Streptococcaceae bacterium]MCH4177964.1 AI-2E family transporter [Streptococcaceae bacterium]